MLLSRGACVLAAARSKWRLLGTCVAIAGAALWFLWPTPLEFPIDDTYIHFVYAQNLAEQGNLAFNSPGEDGVGTTSLLWVVLLAGAHWLGVSMHVVAKALGVAALAVVAIGLHQLLLPIWGRRPALAATLLVALSGNMVWFALSGMETMLFLALGMLGLLVYRQERWLWLGAVLGLMALTRPEGLALAAAIGVVELWRHRGVKVAILGTILVCALVCGPWFVYLLLRTGYPVPTTVLGKRLTTEIGVRLMAERTESVGLLSRIPGLLYVAAWAGFLVEFSLGGMALPPPSISVGAVLGAADYTLSAWAVVALVGVVGPLLWAAARRAAARSRWQGWIQDGNRRPVVTLALWVVLHNLCYLLLLPSPGTASRYGALNHVALWLALTIGLVVFAQRRWLLLWLTAGLIFVAVANMAFWNGVYDANLDHMLNVRIAGACFVRENVSLEERCAAADVGAIRYHGRRPIVDLCGLIDPEAGRWFLEGRADGYLVHKGVTCLVLPGPGGATGQGSYDIAEILGFTTTPLFEVSSLAVFEIEHDRWLRGYLPTGNYQASVVVYKLVPAGWRDPVPGYSD